MNVSDIMSKNVVGVRVDTPLVHALQLMIENQISGLPVLDAAGHPVGILTEGDLMRRAEIGTEGDKPGPLRMFFDADRVAADYVRTHGRKVSELMTSDVVTVTEDTPLGEAAHLIRSRRIKRLPVTRNGVVVGLVSRADLIRALAEALKRPEQTLGDAAIQEAILKEFGQHPWFSRLTVTVSVSDGVVELDGVVFDLRQRDAAQVIAENVPGVKSIENRLVWMDLMTGEVISDPAKEGTTAR